MIERGWAPIALTGNGPGSRNPASRPQHLRVSPRLGASAPISQVRNDQLREVFTRKRKQITSGVGNVRAASSHRKKHTCRRAKAPPSRDYKNAARASPRWYALGATPHYEHVVRACALH